MRFKVYVTIFKNNMIRTHIVDTIKEAKRLIFDNVESCKDYYKHLKAIRINYECASIYELEAYFKKLKAKRGINENYKAINS